MMINKISLNNGVWFIVLIGTILTSFMPKLLFVPLITFAVIISYRVYESNYNIDFEDVKYETIGLVGTILTIQYPNILLVMMGFSLANIINLER